MASNLLVCCISQVSLQTDPLGEAALGKERVSQDPEVGLFRPSGGFHSVCNAILVSSPCAVVHKLSCLQSIMHQPVDLHNEISQ